MFVVGFLLNAVLAIDGRDTAVEPPRPVRADVTLRYLVRCDGGVRKITLTTVLPQDADDWQDVLCVEYQPKPIEIFERNGQRYARFSLVNPGEESAIEVHALVDLGRADLVSRGARSRDPMPKLGTTTRKLALAPERFVESEHESIRSVSRRIRGASTLDRARSALDLTLENLAPAPYDPRSIGARGALDLRRGDCTEYADLLTALLRADGIPARRCYGLLLESSTTPKHDWTEVYFDELGWVLVDPLHVERGAATFESVKPIYVRLSTLRNDDSLAGYHYFAWQNEGGNATVSDEYVLREVPHQDTDGPVAPAPTSAPSDEH